MKLDSKSDENKRGLMAKQHRYIYQLGFCLSLIVFFTQLKKKTFALFGSLRKMGSTQHNGQLNIGIFKVVIVKKNLRSAETAQSWFIWCKL